jgi:hypothetical protein
MDDVERKMFAQLDDDMPAQRANALEMLREHMRKKTPPRLFRDIVRDDEEHAAKVAALEAQYIQAQQINAQGHAANTKLAAENAVLRRRLSVLLWMKQRWGRLALVTGVAVFAATGWTLIPTETTEHRSVVDHRFNVLADKMSWAVVGSDSSPPPRPIVRVIDGEPYWVAFRYDANASHLNADGETVVVHCVHLFAAPAVADAGVYLKPRPYSLFGLGWLTWPERGMSCKPVDPKMAESQ